MTLLNVDAALPSQTWAVVRLLAYLGKSIAVNEARALVSPPSLQPEDSKSRPPFENAISSLSDLGLVHIDGESQELSLAGPARELTSSSDLDAYTSILRRAVLDADRNINLGADNDLSGPRDLTRALAWLLSLDPMDQPVDWVTAQKLLDKDIEKDRVLRPEVHPIFANETRWLRLGHWAPALGLAAAPLIRSEGRSPLVSDCTAAIKQTVNELWQITQRVNAVEALRTLRESLPVLPGGAHSLAIGVTDPGENVAGPALSFALLRGHDEKWIRLEHDDDARKILLVHDPERPASPRPVSDITILEAIRG
ncbi:protein DpdG [Streptomyces telluris]|uniref:Uncharacterized protein n=1 Tax=Streptomyces telluris TaxID=2720021 RepID=A0A9X2RR35_9ACTN|nr:protein DpdG [Streptomyces telluris]MCQ8774869.1 hypothetical protein [Streptomyces telluris]NJP76747.1 hypothetical protein [Streptomyces telluris]